VLYERVLRPALFRLHGGDAETAHETTLRALARASRHPGAVAALRATTRGGGTKADGTSPRTVFGVRFPNPVGLAAGMDKDGRALPAWPALGFGFVEVGTVTAHAQPGNDRPRLFRLRESGAIINRMGFNNAGAEALAARLDQIGPLPVPLGISLGKSKVTPIEDAVDDYVTSLRALRRFGDYFAINVSSPNTPGLRALQDASALEALLVALRTELATTVTDAGRTTPILVKIAPDLDDSAIAELLEVCLRAGVAGLIATNTTLARDGLTRGDQALASQAGGLSGQPLAVRAREVVAFVHKETGGSLPVIGVGGISSAADATAMFDAGASLIQIYTGLIYHGPALITKIIKAAR
jgi:dihydroorotate dehydrogenase